MRLVIPENFDIPPIPAGWYRVSVIGNEVQTSKEGNQMINWHMRVESQGSDPAVPTVGRMLFERSVIVEKCLFRLNNLLKAATGGGLPKGEIEVDALIAYVVPRILNSSLLVQVIHEEWEGQQKENIKNYKPISAPVAA